MDVGLWAFNSTSEASSRSEDCINLTRITLTNGISRRKNGLGLRFRWERIGKGDGDGDGGGEECDG